MHEHLSPTPVPQEVTVTRKWLVEEIAGRGICPPLARLLNAVSEAGSPDWSRLDDDIVIESVNKLEPNESELLEKVSAAYLKFIVDSINGNSPLTIVIILPDFDNNPAYDAFMREVKLAVFKAMTRPLKRRELIKKAYRMAAKKQQVSEAEIEATLANKKVFEIVAIQVIEGVFNPVYFYGKPLSDSDISDMTNDRGPRERQKVLSRVPHYLFQAVNQLASIDHLTGSLNKPKLYQRNTEIARNDLGRVDEKMRHFRTEE